MVQIVGQRHFFCGEKWRKSVR